jgi:ABC-type siderophore export system fused ATPase/permease subunit
MCQGQTASKLYSVCRVAKAQVALLVRVQQGRLLARFSADAATIDDDLPFTANFFLATAFGFAAAVAVMLLSQPLLLVLIVPIAVLLHRIQVHYRCALTAVGG